MNKDEHALVSSALRETLSGKFHTYKVASTMNLSIYERIRKQVDQYDEAGGMVVHEINCDKYVSLQRRARTSRLTKGEIWSMLFNTLRCELIDAGLL
jgi:hypothetical protein